LERRAIARQFSEEKRATVGRGSGLYELSTVDFAVECWR
jgi:hypothetical protein